MGGGAVRSFLHLLSGKRAPWLQFLTGRGFRAAPTPKGTAAGSKTQSRAPAEAPPGRSRSVSGELAFSQIQMRTEAAHSSDLYSRWAGSSAAHVKPETAACASELTGSGRPLMLSSGWTLWTLVISLLGPPCPGCAPACTVLLPGTSGPPDARHHSGSGTGGGQRGRRGQRGH